MKDSNSLLPPSLAMHDLSLTILLLRQKEPSVFKLLGQNETRAEKLVYVAAYCIENKRDLLMKSCCNLSSSDSSESSSF